MVKMCARARGNYGCLRCQRCPSTATSGTKETSAAFPARTVHVLSNYSRVIYRQDSSGTFTGRSTFGLHRGEHRLDPCLDRAVHPPLLLRARIAGVARDQAGVPSSQRGAADRSGIIEFLSSRSNNFTGRVNYRLIM